MKRIVVDTNILISAFIADSTTRHLIRDLDVELYAPGHLKQEVDKYDELITEKSGLTDSELARLKQRLFKYIQFIPEDHLAEHRSEAIDALADTDPDDVIFLATALAEDATIWSDDTDLQQQGLAPTVTTTELVDRIDG